MIDKIFSHGWKEYSKRLWTAAGIVFAVSLIFLISMGLAALAFAKGGAVLYTISAILAVVAFLDVVYGQSIVAALAAGEKKYFDVGVKKAWTLFFAKLIVGLILAGVIIIGIIPALGAIKAAAVEGLARAVMGSAVAGLTFLAAVLVDIYLSVKFFFVSPAIFIDNEGVCGSIKKSWKTTRFWELLLFAIAMDAIITVISLVPYIGSLIVALFVSPFYLFAIFAAFRLMNRRKRK